jgi:hypothetical protein
MCHLNMINKIVVRGQYDPQFVASDKVEDE